ncbi:hypothetical protein ACTJIJ_19850 [Niabella sp. 22666]|uniref:hypothetical protein n=1 Tax=Niabella sp. 22666 TaxID=3453954 RepID=UPI003F82D1F8
MTIIAINKKQYPVPQTGNELTRKKYLQVIDALFLKQYNEWQLPLKLLKILANLSWWRWFRLSPDVIAEYEYLTSFIMAGKLHITEQLIPCFRSWWQRRYYGPCRRLDNLKMKEFVFSEHYFMEWGGKVENVESLNNLVAVLYRPAKWFYNVRLNPKGDARRPFNENILERQVKKVAPWPMVVKLAVATWYGCCREQIVEENADVFGGDGEAAKYGMISIIRSVAKEGTHGNFESVEDKLLPLIMIELNETVAEVKKMEELNRQNSI